MDQVFGRPIEFSWTPHVNGEPVSVFELVSARIYSDLPAEDQIEDSATLAGAIERVTSWRSESNFEKVIAFSPLTDEDPHSSSDYESYFIVINFRYASGAPIAFDKETLFVYRPDSFSSKITITPNDLLGVEPDLARAGRSPVQLERMIARAKEDVLLRLEAIDERQRRRLFNLHKLNAAVLYRATALACMSLYKSSAPEWLEKFRDSSKSFEQFFAISKPGYDVTGADDPRPTEHIQNKTVYLQR